MREHLLYGPVSAVLVEDKANGSAVISHLTGKISGLIEVNPEGGKTTRIVAASPEFQAHDWHFDRTACWTNTLVTQLTMFPNARHDDLSDAVTQAAVWLQKNRVELGLIGYYKAIAGVAAGILRLAPQTRMGTPAVFEPVVPSPTLFSKKTRRRPGMAGVQVSARSKRLEFLQVWTMRGPMVAEWQSACRELRAIAERHTEREDSYSSQVLNLGLPNQQVPIPECAVARQSGPKPCSTLAENRNTGSQ